MLTFRQVNLVVRNDLRIINNIDIENIEERDGEVIYTVAFNTEPAKEHFSLGKYRVWEYEDGSGRSGWMPLKDPSPEVENLRNFIFMNLIIPDLNREDKSLEMVQGGGGQPEKQLEKDDLSRLIPKDKKTIGNFKKAWAIWNKMLKEYEEEVLDNASKLAKPKVQDFRARVVQEMKWRVTERRLQTVIQLGEAKLLK